MLHNIARCRWSVLQMAVVLAIIFVYRPAAAESDVSTWQEVIQRLRDREGDLASLAIAIDYVQESRLGSNDGQKERFNVVAIAPADGRVWWEVEGEKSLDEAGKVTRDPNRRTFGYDGQVARQLDYDDQGRPLSGDIRPTPMWFGISPWEIATASPDGRLLSRFLEDRVDSVHQQENSEVLVLETEPVAGANGTLWKYRFEVAPQFGYAVRSRIQLTKPKDGERWRKNDGFFAKGFQQIEGIWLPNQVAKLLGGLEDGTQPLTKLEGTVRQWQINVEVPDRTFRVKFPPGLFISDRRVSPAKTYRTPAAIDSTAPSANQGASIYDEDADVKAEIAIAVDRAAKQKKRVLIVFGGNWCAPCHRLHNVLQNDGQVQQLLAERYELVMADVERLDDDDELAAAYDSELIRKRGVPFLVVLDDRGRILVRQPSAALENEYRPGFDPVEVRHFLDKWSS